MDQNYYDGAFDPSANIAGIRVVRDCEGVVVDDSNKSFLAASVLISEAMALKDGVC